MATTAGKGPDIPERGDPVGSDRSYRHRFVAVWPDVECQARQRMALEAVAGAIERMPVDDRAVLIGRAQTSTSGDPRRDAHRRHRLRAQLAKVVEGLLGVFPGILRQLRR